MTFEWTSVISTQAFISFLKIREESGCGEKGVGHPFHEPINAQFSLVLLASRAYATSKRAPYALK